MWSDMEVRDRRTVHVLACATILKRQRGSLSIERFKFAAPRERLTILPLDVE